MTPRSVITTLAAFVAGVFVGAGLWFALIVFATALVAWRLLGPPPPPDRHLFR